MPLPPVFKAGGRWNAYEIEARGSVTTVKLNGVRTVRLDHPNSSSGPFAL